jgi:hypothetical protein
MTEEHFVRNVKHFVARAQLLKDSPAFLVLDNHDSHLSIGSIDYCKQNGVTVLNFPTRCSHKLQPLDRSVNGSLTTYVNRAYDASISNNPGATVTIYDNPAVVNTPFHLTPFPANTEADFQVSGI